MTTPTLSRPTVSIGYGHTAAVTAVLTREFGFGTRKVVANILAWYDVATTAERADGIDWYPAARREIADMSQRHEHPFAVCAAVVSHLSPQLGWTANVRAAHEFLASPMVRPNAVLGMSYRNALRALTSSSDPLATFAPRAHKTRSFYLNFQGDDDAVTVDRHALRVAVGDYSPAIAGALTRIGVYESLAHAYRVAARRVGTSPAELQAVTWVAARNRGGEL